MFGGDEGVEGGAVSASHSLQLTDAKREEREGINVVWNGDGGEIGMRSLETRSIWNWIRRTIDRADVGCVMGWMKLVLLGVWFTT